MTKKAPKRKALAPKRSARATRAITKRPSVRKDAIKAQSEIKRYLETLPLKERKQMIADALEAMVVNTPLKQRANIAEHITDVGIELLGHVYGVDTEHAIVMLPEDSVTRLIMALDRHEQETNTPLDEIITRLIETLNTGPRTPLFN